MFIRKKRHRSGNIGVIVVKKIGGKMKELERMLKVSEIKMSVDKVLALAKTITTIQIELWMASGFFLGNPFFRFIDKIFDLIFIICNTCLLYTSPSPRD